MENRPRRSQNAGPGSRTQSDGGSVNRRLDGARPRVRALPNQATNGVVEGQSRRGAGGGVGGGGDGAGPATRVHGSEHWRYRGRGGAGGGGYGPGGDARFQEHGFGRGDRGGRWRGGSRNRGGARGGCNDDNWTGAMGRGQGGYSLDRGGGRPGERRNNGPKSEAPKGLGFKRLQEMSTMEPSEVAISVSSHPALRTLLGEPVMRPDLLELLCLVLSKAFRSKVDRSSLQHLASLIKDSGFLRTVLPHYLAGVSSEADAGRREKCPQQLENILSILTQVLSIFPACSVQPVSLIVTLLPVALGSLRTSGVTVPAQIEDKMADLSHLVTHLQTRSREGTLRSDKDTYALLPIGHENPDAALQEFRTIPIYPTPEELRHEDRPYLRPNLTSQRYPSTLVYLDTHFRLLREDFVRPLREGIQELLWTQMNIGQLDNPANQPRGKRLDDIRIYHDTRVIAPKCTTNGLAYIVQFNVEPLKFVRWENSKRLIYGSLVCLSCDNFESFLFATVADRDPAELKDGKVQIIFTEESRNRLAGIQNKKNQNVFLMVETTAYFEAYRYVLEGLQEQEEDELPFQRYLVDCTTDVQPPVYLQRSDSYDLSSVTHPDFKGKVKPFHCLDPEAWPSMEKLGLDESQFRAFKSALTQELAIIQGPPGTGKTYVGLKIAQALLTNQTLWRRNSPILVVCYTNHALDQFLEGIHKFLPDGIVRVGGRSSSEILKRFNLREVAQREKAKRNLTNHLSAAFNTIFRELCEAERKLQVQSMQLECSAKGVLRENCLKGYMSSRHWVSLHVVQNEDGFEMMASRKLNVIIEWLGLQGLLQQDAVTPPAGPVMQEAAAVESDEEVLIKIAEEADMMEADRIMDDFIYSRGGKDKKRETEQAVREVEALLLAMSLDEPEPKPKKEQRTPEPIWELQKEQKKKIKTTMKRELRNGSSMTDEEEAAVTDVWRLRIPDRWKLYRLWISRYRMELRTKSMELEQEYQTSVQRLADVKRQQDCRILKEATVIGMTTTGAAKFRHTLQQVRPRLVIVEEAAEVLEAHTITTLSSACQHLILIGDHQQLRPSATVYELAKNFHLEMSMFERLVNMNLPFVRLNYQHRMRPDIARLLTPHIYSELENHPSVLDYESIKGLSTNLFFVEHKHLEVEIRDGKSHQNIHEAEFVVALCRYLLLQEYKPEQITILTTYTGQLFCLRKLMPAKEFSGVKVHVVDKYQGEENDIVLLSLVRSNSQHKVGFLNIPNRVCVALSRAKKGLYCIGNSEMLGQVKLWSNIFLTLGEKGQIGPALTLCCQNHPSRQVTVATAADFAQAPEGGCLQPCEYRLDCGHVCTKVCHPADPEHRLFQCLKPCQKILCDLGHQCPRTCYQICCECQVPVEKIIPQCQHTQTVPCHQDPDTFICQMPCPKTLECGHPCVSLCGAPCTTSCEVKIHFDLKCGHSKMDFCFYKTMQREPTCTAPCKQQLKCGHVCSGTCSRCHTGRYHRDCSHKCERLLICSHKCKAPCTNCPPCTRKCENRCVHSRCCKPCGQPCSPCAEPCAWRCPHQSCSKLCHEPCDRPPCDEPCDLTLPCGHPCIGLCGEKCPAKCRVCHREEVTEIFFGFEDDQESRFIELQDCGHVIERRAMDQYMQTDQTQQENEVEVAIKLKECPRCRTPIRKNLRYGSYINRCLAEIELVKQKVAGNKKDIQKQAQLLLEQLNKDRQRQTIFLEEADVIAQKLSGPHLSLFDLWIIGNKMDFSARVSKLMEIGNTKMDYDDTILFDEWINIFLGWLKEGRQRFTEQQVLDLERELKRLTLLAELNVHCNVLQSRGERLKIQAEEETLRNVFDKCGQFSEDDEAGVNQILEELKKNFPLSALGISEDERKMIVSAIQQPGHWFKCPNGHVYLITECGGAMETRKCPECNANIGGRNHSLASGNQLASEMDGVRTPAWPTALQPQLYEN